MKKTGRPEKSKGTAKEEYIELRLDAADKQAFWDAANLSGMGVIGLGPRTPTEGLK
jgi:hypothetical protein